MKRKLTMLFAAVAALALAGVVNAYTGGTTSFPGLMKLWSTTSGPTCTTATGDGSLCAQGDVETDDDVLVGDDLNVTDDVVFGDNLEVNGTITFENDGTLDNATNNVFTFIEAAEDWLATFSTGANTITFSSTTGLTPVFTPATAFTGDVSVNGGAGAITTTGSGDSSILVADADSTALVIGAAGALDILGIDSTDASPHVDVTGINGQTGLHINAGTLLAASTSTFTGDASFNGGAGAITLSGSGDSSIVLADADATALVVGATGALDILAVDTTDASPQVHINGINGQTALHVNVGNLVCDEGSTFTGDISANGGAGAITTSASGDSTLVATDADATAFCMGATGALDLVCLDTTDASPSWDIKGVVGQVSLDVDAGTASFDELATFDAGANMDGDVTFGGGAGAVTFDAANASIVTTDNSATGLVMGSTDRLDLLTLDTRDGAETVIVTGTTTAEAFSVPTGTSTFAEIATFTTGLSAPIVASTFDKIRFCGNGPDGGTETFVSPVAQGADATFWFGGAGCDAEDDPTIGNADELWHAGFAFKTVGISCVGLCTGGTAANDALVFKLYDDTAAVSGMTCTTATLGGDGVPAQCSAVDTTPATVAAGSLLAIGIDNTDDDCNDAGDDFECILTIQYQ